MTAPLVPQTLLRDPNDLQRAASNPLASVWVSASAGSGKTTVLTSRVARLLLQGVRPEKILCLTYTRAGASEMANRLTGMLSNWAVCDESELDKDLDRLQGRTPEVEQKKRARRLFAEVISCPGGLRIRTIHSFCQEILSRFPLEAGLPPHFSLIDDADKMAMEANILDDLLLEADGAPEGELGQDLQTLIASHGEAGFTTILQEIIQSRGRIEAALIRSGSVARLKAQVEQLTGAKSGETVDAIRKEAMEKMDVPSLRKMAGWLSEAKPGSRFAERGRRLELILDLDPSVRTEAFNDYLRLFLTEKNTELSPTHVASKEVRALHPEVDRLSSSEAFRLLKLLGRLEAASIAEITNAVISFGICFTKRLTEAKSARALLDYEDLILYTEKLLSKSELAPWVLFKLDNGIDHMLVDEAQDTSKAQWSIIQSLVEEFYAGFGKETSVRRTLFVVGDEKQSIFGFQNANPEAFLSLRQFFSERFKNSGALLEKIPLHTSFRSAPAILKVVDQIFAEPDSRSGVSPEPIVHRATRNQDGTEKFGRVEVWPLLKTHGSETEESEWALPLGYEEEHDPQAALAQTIALKVRGWLDSGQTIAGTLRAITPGDIMILLRRRGRFADLMVRALKSNRVPVTGVDRMRLIAQLPVMDLLAIIRFVLLPEDDLNLAVLLRGPLFKISEEDLMELAIGREGTLWDSLRKAQSFADAARYLVEKLAKADFSTPFAFLSGILNGPCPASVATGRKALWARLGEEALDPIEELLNEAQEYSRTNPPSLQLFLHWLTKSNTEIKRELDHGGGQVRIMTIHASKGLEAPIIFLPDTASVPLSQALPKLQWASNEVPLFLSSRPEFGPARELWQMARTQQMEEYRRLFYVALTRAASQLYICGWLDGKAEVAPDGSWYKMAAETLTELHQPAFLEASGVVEPDLVVADPYTDAVNPTKQESAENIQALPAWSLEGKRPESGLSVSGNVPYQEPTATPDIAFTRGRIIHRLLQSLPSVRFERRSAAAKRFLSQPRHGLDSVQQEEILTEVDRLMNEPAFAALFGTTSVAEVPLTGVIDHMPVFRQIDRLSMHEGEVWIVDYKTNRPPPRTVDRIPATYRIQLQEYRVLLRQIYPDHNIRTFLLWTYGPRLMEIEV